MDKLRGCSWGGGHGEGVGLRRPSLSRAALRLKITRFRLTSHLYDDGCAMPRYDAKMSRRLDLATVKLRFQHKYLRLLPLGMGAVLSGCSLLPVQDRPMTQTTPQETSALMLRQADARGYAAGFEAGRRLQALRDRESAAAEAKSSASASSMAVLSVAVPPVVTSSNTAASSAVQSEVAAAPAAPVTAAGAGPSLLVPPAAAAPASGQGAPKPSALGQTAQAAPSPVADPGPPATGNFVPRGVASPVDGSPNPF